MELFNFSTMSSFINRRKTSSSSNNLEICYKNTSSIYVKRSPKKIRFFWLTTLTLQEFIVRLYRWQLWWTSTISRNSKIGKLLKNTWKESNLQEESLFSRWQCTWRWKRDCMDNGGKTLQDNLTSSNKRILAIGWNWNNIWIDVFDWYKNANTPYNKWRIMP